MLAGLGAVELLILLGIVVVLFGGPAVVAFWFGYNAGKKSANSDTAAESGPGPVAAPHSETEKEASDD